jgi:hypothetical protein
VGGPFGGSADRDENQSLSAILDRAAAGSWSNGRPVNQALPSSYDRNGRAPTRCPRHFLIISERLTAAERTETETDRGFSRLLWFDPLMHNIFSVCPVGVRASEDEALPKCQTAACTAIPDLVDANK